MGLDPKKVALFIPPGLAGFKMNLFERIGLKIGHVVRHNFSELDRLPDDVTPIVGCTPELRPLIVKWMKTNRQWVYWDRGYFRRVFATDLPPGKDGGMYRWHINRFQMGDVKDVPDDRWKKADTKLWPWHKNGKHVVVAEPSPTYAKFHGIPDWTDRTVKKLREVTDRPIVLRDKEMQRFGRKLHEDIRGAHALVSHGSNAAVEAAIMGCPVFVDPCSAASLVGKTNLEEIEDPIYPDREPWVRSLSYCQFDEKELVDGTLWRLIR